jgi:diphthamide biosynthesis protein 4
MTHTPTYYEILNLPPILRNESLIPSQTLRSAYHHALLRNHPDKSASLGANAEALSSKHGEIYSIDQISEAFSVLSDAKLRGEYDLTLRLQRLINVGSSGGDGNEGKGFKTGVEMVDLDDLETETTVDGMQLWWRGCRCGNERGFVMLETELDSVASEGEKEVGVGCQGCSLWLRVAFGVLEEGGKEGGGGVGGSKERGKVDV